MSTRKIDNPRAWLAEQVAHIRARKDLSEQGRVAHIGKAYREAKKAADSKTANDTAEWELERDRMHRKLFSPPGGPTAEWRRLRDEAATVKDRAEVLRRLELAISHGDELEARAYGSVALDRVLAGGPAADQWVSVANRWGQADQDVDDALTALSAHMPTNPNSNLRDRMFSGVPKPEELARDNSWESRVNMADAGDGSDLTPVAQKREADLNTMFRHAVGVPGVGSTD